MVRFNRFAMLFLALVILIGATGITAQPAQAATCKYWHTVQWGQSLSIIGSIYGISWQTIANANGISYPYKVYAGQSLCIPAGYYYPAVYYPVTTSQGWSFGVDQVVKNTSVTIRMFNFPDNVTFKAKMRSLPSGNWVDLPDVDTGKGNHGKVKLSIPVSLSGSASLSLRLAQVKKNGKTFAQTQSFMNSTYRPGTGGPGYWNYPYQPYQPYYAWRVPTIWISAVKRNQTVTITTRDFPANLSFDVYMGSMGNRGYGYYVTTFNSGAGGARTLTFNIPPALYGSYQISIRTQNSPTGYFSYNWFYNNSTY